MGYNRGIRLGFEILLRIMDLRVSLSISHASGFSDFVIRIRATVVAYI